MNYRLFIVSALSMGWLLLSSLAVSNQGVDPKTYLESYRVQLPKFEQNQISAESEYTIRWMPGLIPLVSSYLKGTVTQSELHTASVEARKTVRVAIRVTHLESEHREFLKKEKVGWTYEQRIQYYSFGMKSDLSVQDQNGNPVPIENYYYERDFGLSSAAQIFLELPLHKGMKTLKLTLADRLYGDGQMQFTFDLNELKTLPTLKPVSKWKTT